VPDDIDDDGCYQVFKPSKEEGREMARLLRQWSRDNLGF
jgi:hypothetical protein